MSKPNNDYETLLENIILPELEMGRPKWDKPHTIAVVDYIKDIIDSNPNLNLDRDVLVIAAYAHDWGYSGLFRQGEILDSNDVKKAKEMHMKISADKLSIFLRNEVFGFLSNEQKSRAVHLVSVHDKLDILRSIDEIVLMEADTLGGLDVNKVKPIFDKLSNDKYMLGVQNKRYPLFTTRRGKELYYELYKLRQDYYSNMN